MKRNKRALEQSLIYQMGREDYAAQLHQEKVLEFTLNERFGLNVTDCCQANSLDDISATSET